MRLIMEQYDWQWLLTGGLLHLNSEDHFQCHSFKISVTHPLPSIIYFPLHMIHLSCLGSKQPHGSHVLCQAPKNNDPLLIML